MKDRTSGERLGGSYPNEGEQPLGTKDTDVCTKLRFPRSIVGGCPEIRKPGKPYSRQNNA